MNIQQAKKDRTVQKCRLTRYENSIRQLSKEEQSKFNCNRMKVFLASVEDAFKFYKAIQDDIINHISEDQYETEIADYARIEEQYTNIKATAESFLDISDQLSTVSSSKTSNTIVRPDQQKPPGVISKIMQKFRSTLTINTAVDTNKSTSPKKSRSKESQHDRFNPTPAQSVFYGFSDNNSVHRKSAYSPQSRQRSIKNQSIVIPDIPDDISYISYITQQQPEIVTQKPEIVMNNPVPLVQPTPQNQTAGLDELIKALSTNFVTQSLMPQLPPITFSGESVDWPEFRDLFIGLAKRLNNDMDRLTMLKIACKDGKANRLVKYFNTSEGYLAAWESLIQEYDQEKLIIVSHMKTLLHQKQVVSNSSASLKSFYTTSDTVIRQLQSIQYTSRDLWLITILVEKLDPKSAQAWSHFSNNMKLPTIQDFLKFLSNRCKALEMNTPSNEPKPRDTLSRKQPLFKTHHAKPLSKQKSAPSTFNNTPSTQSSERCSKCKGDHWLYKCSIFLTMTPQERSTFVLNTGLCKNCLRKHDTSSTCPSRYVCKHCSQHHHSLLHQPTPTVSSTVANVLDYINDGLSPTALALIKAPDGSTFNVRILLDTGSTVSFISESIVKLLRLRRQHSSIAVSGTGGTITCLTRGITSFEVCSPFDQSKSIQVHANILKKVTKVIPDQRFDISNWTHLKKLQLADPMYNEPNRVDVIIGSQYFVQSLTGDMIKGSPGTPDAIKSIFGWLVLGDTGAQGRVFTTSTSHHNTLLNIDEPDTDALLKRFWEIEEVPSMPEFTEEEKEAEEHFQQTHIFENGRFTVRLPFKEGTPKLGNSFNSAYAQALTEERRSQRNPVYKQMFHDFMLDIANRGHWEEVPSSELSLPDDQHYYMKRHGVLKESSTTTKLRVVVNASSSTSNGVSLNDILMLGAKQQQESLEILLRHRTYKYVYTTDIEKMYRMINLNPLDRNFQRILWRENESDPLKHYRLTTVIYGTRPGSFLATRSLTECARLHAESYPDASKVLLNDAYVDDISSGNNDFDKCKQTMTELKLMLHNCGFNARKWTANHPDLLINIPPEEREIDLLELGSDEDTHLKLLGVLFDPKADHYLYEVKIEPAANGTRRTMLSELSRIYDPFGIIQPSVVVGKIQMQEVWFHGTGWDEPLPSHIQENWKRLCNEFHLLNHITVPRYVPNADNIIHLHAFCDASEQAYCAVIYAFSDAINPEDSVGNILISKTKVAPVKPVSIARLELCSAVLLSKLVKYVTKSLQHLQVKISAYTDSTTVIAWLSQHPRRWKTFVANRVAAIIEVVSPDKWSHVSGIENPADVGSRGLFPSQLVNCQQWFKGPDWLYKSEEERPISKQVDMKTAMIESRKQITSHQTTIASSNPILEVIISRISKYHKMVIVMVYVLKAVQKFKQKVKLQLVVPFVKQPITVEEFNEAEIVLIKMVQQEAYSQEITKLKSNNEVQSSSKLIKLYPFLDSNGLLRVGGRLQSSTESSYDMKHPIILPGKHLLIKQMARYMHRINQHAGTTLLTNILFQRFWIINARELVKNTIFQCIRCYILKRRTAKQLMGTLPKCRVNQNPAFLHVGVDYAGPFIVRMFRIRKATELKVYVALYVCMVTKAIHLELAEDLSTEGFLATFSRFVSVRGLPSDVYSDQGTNFVGANRDLQSTLKTVYCDKRYEEFMLQRNIKWHFNPPRSPHHGGLWESNVKSMKTHFKKLFGENKLTVMELQTILKNVEACLNSRPIGTKNRDVNDLEPLTPGHFLIGRPILTIPQRDYSLLNASRLKSYDMVRKLLSDFWNRWKNEYLHTLQERPKWQSVVQDLKEGDLVALMIEDTPPTIWPLARVINIYPGPDGRVRVVDVKTSKNTYKRSVQKLVKIPDED